MTHTIVPAGRYVPAHIIATLILADKRLPAAPPATAAEPHHVAVPDGAEVPG